MVTKTAALDHLVSAHYDQLVSWCRCVTGRQREEAEDIVHAAYLRSRPGYRAEFTSPARPLAYLQRSIRSELADRRRSESRRRERETQAVALRRPWHESSPSSIAAAREALDTLRGRPRQVCLALLSGKSSSQVCDELQVSKAALAVYLNRAKRTLACAD